MSQLKETTRVEAFSDGVFAIAITLLVLEIKVPPIHDIHSVPDLWHSLLHLWPSYFAFTFSFGTLLVSWANHHNAFTIIQRVSMPFIYGNGFLLLTTTFLPFPTALLAEYINTEYAQPAIVFFCIAGVLNNLAWNLFIETSMNPINLLTEGRTHIMKTVYRRACRTGFFVYIFTALIAWWFPIPALLLNVSVWMLWIFLSLVDSIKAREGLSR